MAQLCFSLLYPVGQTLAFCLAQMPVHDSCQEAFFLPLIIVMSVDVESRVFSKLQKHIEVLHTKIIY